MRVRTRSQLEGLRDLARTVTALVDARGWNKTDRNIEALLNAAVVDILGQRTDRLEVDWRRLKAWLKRWELSEKRLGGEEVESREQRWNQNGVRATFVEMDNDLTAEASTRPPGRG